METVVRHLRRTVHSDAASGDAQLLTAFINNRDEAAFTSLVKRHGPMVWGVCRRLLDHHDAEDCFQVTFLVLARRARSVRPREMVGNWLHGVAYRTALQARATRLKQQGREKPEAQMPEPAAAPQEHDRDLYALLDRELTRLPETYRLPIILCDLGNASIKDAARQLGWPQGTLAGRLFRARKLLATRLARRGLAVAAGSLACHEVASAGMPPSLVESAIKAASSQVVPTKVAPLMQGVITAMLIAKLKTVAVVLVALTAVGVGGGLLSRSTTVAAQAPVVGKQEARTPAAAYKAAFGKTLAVIAEHFEEITYANQYDGRIEACTCNPDTSGVLRKADVRLTNGEGAYFVDIHIRQVKVSRDIIGRDVNLEAEVLAKLQATGLRYRRAASVAPNPQRFGTDVNSQGGLTGSVVTNASASLRGTWRVVSINGGEGAFTVFKHMDLVFVGERLLVVPNDSKDTGPATVYRVHLGTKRPVQEVDFYRPGSSETRILGVYEVRKDELWVCLSNRNGTRPTNVESTKTQALLVARRIVEGTAEPIYPMRFLDSGTVPKAH
jgi:RNA polymerase sigma factor (sigma-70 family)